MPSERYAKMRPTGVLLIIKITGVLNFQMAADAESDDIDCECVVVNI